MAMTRLIEKKRTLNYVCVVFITQHVNTDGKRTQDWIELVG